MAGNKGGILNCELHLCSTSLVTRSAVTLLISYVNHGREGIKLWDTSFLFYSVARLSICSID